MKFLKLTTLLLSAAVLFTGCDGDEDSTDSGKGESCSGLSKLFGGSCKSAKADSQTDGNGASEGSDEGGGDEGGVAPAPGPDGSDGGDDFADEGGGDSGGAPTGDGCEAVCQHLGECFSASAEDVQQCNVECADSGLDTESLSTLAEMSCEDLAALIEQAEGEDASSEGEYDDYGADEGGDYPADDGGEYGDEYGYDDGGEGGA